MSYEVFIERCRSEDLATKEGLAQSIGKRFGVDPRQILSRLNVGPFRIKAGLEEAVALEFMHYLESKGALCTVLDEKGGIVATSSGLSLGDAGFSTLQAVPLDHEKAPQQHEAPNEKFSEDAPEAVWLDSISRPEPAPQSPSEPQDLQVGYLDQTHRQPGQAGQDAGKLRHSSEASPAYTDDDFRPPESKQPLELEINAGFSQFPTPAPEEGKEAIHSRPIDTSLPLGESAAKLPAVPLSLPQRIVRSLAASSRSRFTIGVVVALFVGFVVMSPIASSRESSSYKECIAELSDYQASPTASAQSWEQQKQRTLEELQSRRTKIALTSLLIWLFIAALVWLGWTRVIRWQRWQETSSVGTNP